MIMLRADRKISANKHKKNDSTIKTQLVGWFVVTGTNSTNPNNR